MMMMMMIPDENGKSIERHFLLILYFRIQVELSKKM